MPDYTSPRGEVFKDDPSYPNYAYGPENAQGALEGGTGVPGTCGLFNANQGISYHMRVVPSRRIRVTKMRFRVMVAAGTDDPVDVGIYDAAGVKLVSSGFVAGQINSTGIKEVNFPSPVTLEAGKVYYIAWAALLPTTTSAQILSHSPGTAECWTFYGTAVPAAFALTTGAGILPATMAGAAAPVVNALPKIAVIEG